MNSVHACYWTLTTQWPWVPSTGLNLKPLFGNGVKTTKSTQNCEHSCCTWEVLVQCGYWECKASRNRAIEQHGHCGNGTDSCGISKNCNHVLWTNYILWNIVFSDYGGKQLSTKSNTLINLQQHTFTSGKS